MGSDIKSNIIELCSTLLPEPGQRTGTAAGAASQAFHLPEDLSGPPPLRESVAGREYHCRLTRSLQGSVPPLFPDGQLPLATTNRFYGSCLPQWVIARPPALLVLIGLVS